MRRTLAIAAGLGCIAVASVAATDALDNRADEVIEIEVQASELQECRDTLRQVSNRPAVQDDGSPILFDFSNDLPGVRCVVSESV